MPIMGGRDSKGSYYKFGKSGKKYYYTANNKNSRQRARNRAMKQGRAMKANKGK